MSNGCAHDENFKVCFATSTAHGSVVVMQVAQSERLWWFVRRRFEQNSREFADKREVTESTELDILNSKLSLTEVKLEKKTS